MGYDVHITRRENWFDEDGPDIPCDEWLELVNEDPEMRHDGFAETRTGDGSVLRMERDGLSVWTAYSAHQENGNKAWFDYRDGRITVKNPDKEILVKMWLLAQRLSATVQGDEGERYDGSGTAVGTVELGTPDTQMRKPWWRFW